MGGEPTLAAKGIAPSLKGARAKVKPLLTGKPESRDKALRALQEAAEAEKHNRRNKSLREIQRFVPWRVSQWDVWCRSCGSRNMCGDAIRWVPTLGVVGCPKCPVDEDESFFWTTTPEVVSKLDYLEGLKEKYADLRSAGEDAMAQYDGHPPFDWVR